MIDEVEFQDQLDRLERAWERLGAPVLKYLRPGLSDAEIDDLMAPTDLTLPAELRLWWRWHDGADAPPPDRDEFRDIASGAWEHIALHEAVALYDLHDGYYRNYVALGDMEIASLSWRPGLFPFSGRVWKPNHVLAADTFVAERAPAPVCMVTEMGIEAGASAASISEVIGLWVELLESGRYHSSDGMLTPRDDFEAVEPRFLWLS